MAHLITILECHIWSKFFLLKNELAGGGVKMEKFLIMEVEMKRYCVLQKVIEGLITLKDASKLLGLSYRQTIRLKQRFLKDGFKGILKKPPPKPPNLKFSPSQIQKIVNLRKHLYYDFNILHFKEKLKEIHGISISYETLRQILIKAELHEPRKKKKVYRRRRRMPQAGLLVQMDSSQHRWIEEIKEPWWLVAMCDDASGYVYAEFHPKDTTMANMQVIKRFIEKKGLFMALYVDKASHFKTTRHGGLHYNVSVEHKDTQIQRALKELNIEIIHANSPQAKGRIERLFRFFQDRLIKEMKLRGIRDYREANRFLREDFLPWYNQKYNREVESVYRSVYEKVDLEQIFSVKEFRKVNNDNTIRYRGKIFQLFPANGIKNFAGRWVEVCSFLDGSMKIFYEGKVIGYVEISGGESKRIQEEEILNKREYLPDKPKKPYKPPKDHPWRKFRFGKKVTFQTGNKV